ncbi:reverse transcriptase domain-containing protein [Tanacetum coccineum]|uniref:Reverse transcriptase domain-containing protein n=1 Tax=Tanacetum coccineum TaxID=301880 RepID=A0ABQ4XCH5_9ASTR
MMQHEIPIALEDQEKTTFTCPYGTFAYRRMPFGLCNAPATFQRCMTVIFHDMVEDFMEVFMDDFSVFGAENLAADHLSILENPDLGTFTKEEITNEFPDEHLMILTVELNNDEPWYADYINYIIGKIIPPNWMPEKIRRFFSQVEYYFWDEPYAFKLCSDNIMRKCVAGNEIFEILAHCHSGLTRGHHSASITGRKVYESEFYWPSIFKDAKDYVMKCDACQRSGNISSRSEMPQNNIHVKKYHDGYNNEEENEVVKLDDEATTTSREGNIETNIAVEQSSTNLANLKALDVLKPQDAVQTQNLAHKRKYENLHKKIQGVILILIVFKFSIFNVYIYNKDVYIQVARCGIKITNDHSPISSTIEA